TRLVEEGDGVTLFGRALGELSVGPFNRLADRLRVSSVVALDEDQGRLGFVADNPTFAGPSRIGPFLLYTSVVPRSIPTPSGPQRWRLAIPAHGAGWIPTGMAYSPLWQCRAEGHVLPIRRDTLGLLEVNLPAGGATVIDLAHVPGRSELGGLALSGLSGLALFVVWLRRFAASWRARPLVVRPGGRS